MCSSTEVVVRFLLRGTHHAESLQVPCQSSSYAIQALARQVGDSPHSLVGKASAISEPRPHRRQPPGPACPEIRPVARPAPPGRYGSRQLLEHAASSAGAGPRSSDARPHLHAQHRLRTRQSWQCQPTRGGNTPASTAPRISAARRKSRTFAARSRVVEYRWSAVPRRLLPPRLTPAHDSRPRVGGTRAILALRWRCQAAGGPPPAGRMAPQRFQ
jgi:hypothetical protein